MKRMIDEAVILLFISASDHVQSNVIPAWGLIPDQQQLIKAAQPGRAIQAHEQPAPGAKPDRLLSER